MPDRKIREFAAQVDKLYVLEELDPFIEDYVRGLGIECTGKAVLPLYLEYSADIIRRALGLPGVSAAYEAPVQAPGASGQLLRRLSAPGHLSRDQQV